MNTYAISEVSFSSVIFVYNQTYSVAQKGNIQPRTTMAQMIYNHSHLRIILLTSLISLA